MRKVTTSLMMRKERKEESFLETENIKQELKQTYVTFVALKQKMEQD